MPTYEYECQKCGHRFEQFQNMMEEPLKRCPKCRCKLRRLVGAGAGVIFKGSGFYETDYRSRSYKEGAEQEKGGGAPKGGKKEDKASDDKTASGEDMKKKESSSGEDKKEKL